MKPGMLKINTNDDYSLELIKSTNFLSHQRVCVLTSKQHNTIFIKNFCDLNNLHRTMCYFNFLTDTYLFRIIKRIRNCEKICIVIFWAVALSLFRVVYQHFGGTHCLCLWVWYEEDRDNNGLYGWFIRSGAFEDWSVRAMRREEGRWSTVKVSVSQEQQTTIFKATRDEG